MLIGPLKDLYQKAKNEYLDIKEFYPSKFRKYRYPEEHQTDYVETKGALKERIKIIEHTINQHYEKLVGRKDDEVDIASKLDFLSQKQNDLHANYTDRLRMESIT